MFPFGGGLNGDDFGPGDEYDLEDFDELVDDEEDEDHDEDEDLIMVKVDAHQIHVVNCPECGSELIVRQFIRAGDTLICDDCYATMMVRMITAPHHYDRKKPARLETEVHA